METEVVSSKKIKLSDHFTYGRLLRFTLPSVAMMIFTSIYGVVDGFFVANYVGETPFAALNLILPYVLIFLAFGTMFGVGGSALVAVTLGAGDRKKANEIFSLVVYIMIALGAIVSVIGFIFAEPMSLLLGADEEMLPFCVRYARICFMGSIPLILQYEFQSFCIVSEKPKLGLVVTIAAGVTNIVLDWLLVGVLNLGLDGAAYATIAGSVVGGVIPLIYFAVPNSSLLKLGKAKWYGRDLIKVITNGSSEFLTEVSLSIVSMLYNYQLMKYAGQDGVAAYGVIMYLSYVFVGFFFGYSMGASPICGYNYGANNTSELKNVFKCSMRIIIIASIIVVAVSLIFARPLAMIFVGENESLLEMTTTAIRIYCLCYLFAGVNIFGSALFTALNNGLISALISFLRVLVLQVMFVLVLPILFGLIGVWMSVIAAEFCAMILTISCLIAYRKRYNYS